MQRKILLIVGISLLSLVVFVLAIFFTLPSDKFRHFAEKTIEKQLKYKQSVEIKDISVSPMLNVTVKDFKMTPRVTEPPQPILETEGGTFEGYYCAPAIIDVPFIVKEIFVNPVVMSTIKKKPAGTFDIKVANGTIKGELKSQDKAMEITADGSDISLNDFTLLSNISKMQIYGDLAFNANVVLEDSKVDSLEGTVFVADTALCPKRLKLNVAGIPYIDLPFTMFGNIDAEFEIQNNKLIIKKLTSEGPDIKLDVKGDISLKTTTDKNVRLNINAVITPDAKWLADNDMKVIYQVCEKHDDGSIHLKLNGTTKRLKHDCGTPIPEPVEIPDLPPKAEEKKADKPAADSEPAKEAKPKAEKEITKEEPPEEPPKAEKKRLDEGNAVFRPQRGDKNLRMDDAPKEPPDGERMRRSRNGSARPSRPAFDNQRDNERFNRELERFDGDIDKSMRRNGHDRPIKRRAQEAIDNE